MDSFHSTYLYYAPTNLIEILKIINNLKTSSPGYDDIHPKRIEQIFTFINMPLCHIIICSLASGVVASRFNVTNVVPIFMNEQQDNLRNYRPVSILPCFSKILEKLSLIGCFL